MMSNIATPNHKGGLNFDDAGYNNKQDIWLTKQQVKDLVIAIIKEAWHDDISTGKLIKKIEEL